jgi:hypothetical protein
MFSAFVFFLTGQSPDKSVPTLWQFIFLYGRTGFTKMLEIISNLDLFSKTTTIIFYHNTRLPHRLSKLITREVITTIRSKTLEDLATISSETNSLPPGPLLQEFSHCLQEV